MEGCINKQGKIYLCALYSLPGHPSQFFPVFLRTQPSNSRQRSRTSEKLFDLKPLPSENESGNITFYSPTLFFHVLKFRFDCRLKPLLGIRFLRNGTNISTMKTAQQNLTQFPWISKCPIDFHKMAVQAHIFTANRRALCALSKYNPSGHGNALSLKDLSVFFLWYSDNFQTWPVLFLACAVGLVQSINKGHRLIDHAG